MYSNELKSETRNPRHAARLLAMACVCAMILLGGCSEEPKPIEPKEFPFKLSNVRAAGRMVRANVEYLPANMPPDNQPIGILTVYCRKPDFDLRMVGSIEGYGFGARDDALGAHEVFSTIADSAPKDGGDGYLGAWWYGHAEDIDWSRQTRFDMGLLAYQDSGVIKPLKGGGYMIVAFVSGKLSKNDFALLSEPVSIPYEPDAPSAPGG